jgi:CDP-diacylglycerol--serine O-phosphatidyltransferase
VFFGVVVIFVVSSDPPIALFTLFCLYALSGYAYWGWRWFRGEPNPAKPVARDLDRSG